MCVSDATTAGTTVAAMSQAVLYPRDASGKEVPLYGVVFEKRSVGAVPVYHLDALELGADLLGRGEVALSRLEPAFVSDDDHPPQPLGDPHLSRRPTRLARVREPRRQGPR